MSADQFGQPRNLRPDDCAAPAETLQQDADAGGVGFVCWLTEHPWWLAFHAAMFVLGILAGRYWG